MSLLRKIGCRIFGSCPQVYNRREDPVYLRYISLQHRVDNLWRPRELFDV